MRIRVIIHLCVSARLFGLLLGIAQVCVLLTEGEDTKRPRRCQSTKPRQVNREERDVFRQIGKRQSSQKVCLV